MRTTLNIDDTLFREAKIEAVRQGTTLTSLIESALEHFLRAARNEEVVEFPVSPPTGGVKGGVDLTSPDTLYDLLYAEADAAAVQGAKGRRA